MRREYQQTLETQAVTVRREWTVDGIPVLTAAVELPEPVKPLSRAARRIHRYYRAQEQAYLRYCENWLFPQAEAAYHLALASSAPLPSYQARLTYQVTYNANGYWSLYTQSRETDGRQVEMLRRGDTWDLAAGLPQPLTEFLPNRGQGWRKKLRAVASEEIRRQEQAGLSRFHEDWPRRLKQALNRDNFYLTPEGLRFFFQLYAIGPAAEGIPTFLIPFGPEDCRLPRPAALGIEQSSQPTG